MMTLHQRHLKLRVAVLFSSVHQGAETPRLLRPTSACLVATMGGETRGVQLVQPVTLWLEAQQLLYLRAMQPSGITKLLLLDGQHRPIPWLGCWQWAELQFSLYK